MLETFVYLLAKIEPDFLQRVLTAGQAHNAKRKICNSINMNTMELQFVHAVFKPPPPPAGAPRWGGSPLGKLNHLQNPT